MKTINFRMIPKKDDESKDKPVMFNCLDRNCFKLKVPLHFEKLAEHAKTVHGSTKIKANLKDFKVVSG